MTRLRIRNDIAIRSIMVELDRRTNLPYGDDYDAKKEKAEEARMKTMAFMMKMVNAKKTVENAWNNGKARVQKVIDKVTGKKKD